MATPTININRARSATAKSPVEKVRYVWATSRILLGFVFLWAFLDKVFGFGYSTKPENAWINGGNPTYGFLANTKGWFASLYQPLASSQFVEAVFMVGLLGVGLALLLGIGMRVGVFSGIAMLLLMYFAKLPAATNPVYDSDLLYAVVLVGILLAKGGETLGLGKWWNNLAIVKKYPILA